MWEVCGCFHVWGQDYYWDYLHLLHMDVMHAKLKCGGVWQLKICLLSESDSCTQQKTLLSGSLGSVEIAAKLSFPWVHFFIWDLESNSKTLTYLETAIVLFMQNSKLCMISVNRLKIMKSSTLVHSGWEYLWLQLYDDAYKQEKHYSYRCRRVSLNSSFGLI